MVEREDGSYPFSKGLLARSLEVTGLAPEYTYDIASAIEGQIVDMRLEEIDHRDLERMAVELLSERHGEEYAERYRVWRARNDSNKPLVVLICGLAEQARRRWQSRWPTCSIFHASSLQMTCVR